jgi:hypothetical protein
VGGRSGTKGGFKLIKAATCKIGLEGEMKERWESRKYRLNPQLKL